jgi:hypothetical protein
VLRRIHDVRQLSQEQAAQGLEVRLMGVVTYFDVTNGRGMIIHDGREGQFVVSCAERRRSPRGARS